MGYYLYDSNGYVGDLASNHGMQELEDFLEQNASVAIAHLLHEGWVPIEATLTDELKLIPDPTDPFVLKTWKNLKEMLSKCQDVAIISDGAE